MNLKNNKGQMGLLGEDMMTIVIVGFAIGVILIATLKAYTDYTDTYRRLDTYRMGFALAEKAANDYAWAPSDAKRARILNASKLDDGLTCVGDGLCITCQGCSSKWYCGDAACTGSVKSTGNVVVVSIPVVVRIDEKNYHPGTLEVTMAS